VPQVRRRHPLPRGWGTGPRACQATPRTGRTRLASGRDGARSTEGAGRDTWDDDLRGQGTPSLAHCSPTH
jgi:hypothetical protein